MHCLGVDDFLAQSITYHTRWLRVGRQEMGKIDCKEPFNRQTWQLEYPLPVKATDSLPRALIKGKHGSSR